MGIAISTGTGKAARSGGCPKCALGCPWSELALLTVPGEGGFGPFTAQPRTRSVRRGRDRQTLERLLTDQSGDRLDLRRREPGSTPSPEDGRRRSAPPV